MASIMPRYTLIDWLRALAIALMFIYHFSYDLMMLQLIEAASFNSITMTAIGRSCIALFMFCMGYSLALNHNNGMHWPKFWQRWLKIALAAGLVSLVTYLAYPQYWIFFGILHCIAVASLVLLPFLRFPKLALMAGLAMGIAYAFFHKTLPWPNIQRATLDYIPLFPWMWSSLVGVGMQSFKLHEKIHLPYSRSAEWLSRQSLIIYLVHQPVLMGIAYLAWRAVT